MRRGGSVASASAHMCNDLKGRVPVSNLPALHVLNGLMCSDIYSINRALCSGDPRQLDTGYGAALDWEGWESRSQFVDAIVRLLPRLVDHA